jgi:hypothetical protein
MINANDLLRTIKRTGAENFNHRKLCDLLEGIKGTFSKKDIQLVRRIIKDEISVVDKMLTKLENES